MITTDANAEGRGFSPGNAGSAVSTPPVALKFKQNKERVIMGTYDAIKKGSASAILEIIEMMYQEAIGDVEDPWEKDWTEEDIPFLNAYYAAAKEMYEKYPVAFAHYFKRICINAGDNVGAYLSGITQFLLSGSNANGYQNKKDARLAESKSRNWRRRAYIGFANGDPAMIMYLLFDKFEEIIRDEWLHIDDEGYCDPELVWDTCRNFEKAARLFENNPEDLVNVFRDIIEGCVFGGAVQSVIINKAISDYLDEGEIPSTCEEYRKSRGMLQ